MSSLYDYVTEKKHKAGSARPEHAFNPTSNYMDCETLVISCTKIDQVLRRSVHKLYN